MTIFDMGKNSGPPVFFIEPPMPKLAQYERMGLITREKVLELSGFPLAQTTLRHALDLIIQETGAPVVRHETRPASDRDETEWRVRMVDDRYFVVHIEHRLMIHHRTEDHLRRVHAEFEAYYRTWLETLDWAQMRSLIDQPRVHYSGPFDFGANAALGEPFTPPAETTWRLSSDEREVVTLSALRETLRARGDPDQAHISDEWLDWAINKAASRLATDPPAGAINKAASRLATDPPAVVEKQAWTTGQWSPAVVEKQEWTTGQWTHWENVARPRWEVMNSLIRRGAIKEARDLAEDALVELLELDRPKKATA